MKDLTREESLDFLATVGMMHSLSQHPEHRGPKPGCLDCLKIAEACVTIMTTVCGIPVSRTSGMNLEQKIVNFSERLNN